MPTSSRILKPILVAGIFLGCLIIFFLVNLKDQPAPATAQLNRDAPSTDVLNASILSLRQVAEQQATELSTTQAIKPVAVQVATIKQDTKKEDAQPKLFDLTFDDLKFEMEKGSKFERSMLTKTINGYNGGSVKLRGYIRPAFTQTGLTKFIFVRDNKECCFGPGAALYDCVLVKLAKNVKTDYTVRPITIQGKFSLKEYKGPDGKVWAIYRMNNASVK